MTELLTEIVNATAARAADPEAAHTLRRQYQERLAAANGFALPATIVPIGSRLIEAGQGKARVLRAQYEALPTLEQAANRLVPVIEAERRTDLTVPLSSLYIDPVTGRLKRHNGRTDKPGLLLTPTSWSQLISWYSGTPRYAAPYLADVSPERRAREFDAIRTLSADRDVVLGLRVPNPSEDPDTWEVYRVVSQRYQDAGPTYVFEALARVYKGQEVRAEVEYGGPGHLVVNVQAHSTVQPKDLRVGEVLRAGHRVQTADDRTGGADSEGSVTRVLCVNLTLGTARAARWHGRHSARDLLAQLERAAHEAAAAIAPFVELWGQRSVDAIGQRSVDAIEVLRAIAGDLPATREAGVKVQPLVHVPSVEPIQLGEILVDAYRAEPAPTVAGISNALSRAPQVGAWERPLDALEILARAAGDVAREGIDALGVLELIREERTHRANN